MATGGGFRGVSAEQDARFSNKQKKMLASLKLPKVKTIPINNASNSSSHVAMCVTGA
jgi:hypothetical protein